MPTFTPEHLLSTLRRLLSPEASKLCVAYSGGLDSTVLLEALSRIQNIAGVDLRALHVDHQLQPSSSAWSEHCRREAALRGVPFRRVLVDVGRGLEGPEAAARAARYEALRRELGEREVLLTAHHADDQLETVLLALMRGAGPRGLRATPELQPFGRGWLARPLLEFTRDDLARWAIQERLAWIEDPMNENTSLDRNLLRHEVIPRLRARWPAAAPSAVRSTTHLHETVQLLDELAHTDLRAVSIGSCLDIVRLRELSDPRQRNVLRHWLRSFAVRAPSTRRLGSLLHDMLSAHEDRSPCVKLEGAEIRRHRNLLYCVRALPDMSKEVLRWDTRSALRLPEGLGTLHFEPVGRGGIATTSVPTELRIEFRKGGETLKAAGDQYRRSLKKRLQEANVLPWWRGRLPIIYAGDRLVAVGDLWVSAEFAARDEEPGLQVVWSDKPPIAAIDRPQ